MFAIKVKGQEMYLIHDPIMQTSTWTNDPAAASTFTAEHAQAMTIGNSELEMVAADGLGAVFA